MTLILPEVPLDQLQRRRLLQRITAPAAEPLALEETKLYLRVDAADEDSLIGDLITAARMDAEQWLRRSLMTQTWKLAFDGGIPDRIALPMGPVNTAEVTLVQQDGTPQALAAERFWLSAARDTLVLAEAQMAFRVEITYGAGYGAAADVPRPIRQGMLAHVAYLYENRGDITAGVPEQVARFYMPFREVRL